MAPRLLFFIIGICFTGPCQGIQFTLEHDMTPTPGRRATCGVLTCVERSHDGTSSTPSSIQMSDLDSRSVSVPVSTITRMDVYKTGQGASGVQGDKRKPTLVASVSSQQPRVSSVANAVKVDGRMESSITTIRLELFKGNDCRAEFTCEVFAVDAQGRELVRTSHLLQQPPTPAPDTAGEQGWTPAVAVHLVSLAQQINTNMALMRDTMRAVEDKVAGLEKDSTSSMVNLEKGLREDLNFFENRIEDKVVSLEKDVYKGFVDTGTKLDSMTSRVEHKLDQLEDRINKAETNLYAGINRVKDLEKSIGNSIEGGVEKLKHQIGNLTRDECSALGLQISAMSNQQFLLETSLRTDIEQSLKSLKNETELQLAEPLKMSVKHLLQNSSGQDCLSSLGDSFNRLEDSLEGRFQVVMSGINESAIETRAYVRGSINGINVTDASEIASVIADTLSLKTCKKGMISVLTQPSYPYPVVQPSRGDSLTAPFLCDTVTDGGGWIIIQRRTTGNIDFQRSWADYKTGFGTLEDDFWLGNDNIHAITSSGEYELRVDLRYNGKSSFAHYNKFAIADEPGKYALTLGSYDGTAGDSLSYHNGGNFSTLDQDNDTWPRHCAAHFQGAWWHKNCHNSNLNGKWGAGDQKGPRWVAFSDSNAVTFSEMKIRRLS